MPRVKVWNDNVHPHKEKFKDVEFNIAPGEFIEMDSEEAVEFLHQFTGVKWRGDGTHCPTGFKKLRIEGALHVAEVDPLVCHANGQQAATKEDLEKLLQKFGHNRAPNEPSQATDETAALLKAALARIEALEQAGEKRKPGRPKLKEANG